MDQLSTITKHSKGMKQQTTKTETEDKTFETIKITPVIGCS
jgi:hypothetical protein